MTQQPQSAGTPIPPGSGTKPANQRAADLTALPALPLRAGQLAVRDLIDLYMRHYTGRDSTRAQRLSVWEECIGSIALQDLTDDHVHATLDQIAAQPSRYYAGQDAAGQRVYRSKRRQLAPATLNRYVASLAAVITWAVKRRVAPKGYVHPCRSIERQPEHNEKTRFLSDVERTRLLSACKASSWPKLYVLVLLALTTGARKGELLGLRWADIDLERAEAYVLRTKNGEPRVLPLIAAAVDELKPLMGRPADLVFQSARDTGRAFAFEPKFLQALLSAKIRGVTFHTLRHSCASALARNGATLLEIAEVLGHRQLQVTKRYSHLATSHKAALVNRVLGDVQ